MQTTLWNRALHLVLRVLFARRIMGNPAIILRLTVFEFSLCNGPWTVRMVVLWSRANLFLRRVDAVKPNLGNSTANVLIGFVEGFPLFL